MYVLYGWIYPQIVSFVMVYNCPNCVMTKGGPCTESYFKFSPGQDTSHRSRYSNQWLSPARCTQRKGPWSWGCWNISRTPMPGHICFLLLHPILCLSMKGSWGYTVGRPWVRSDIQTWENNQRLFRTEAASWSSHSLYVAGLPVEGGNLHLLATASNCKGCSLE